MPKIPLTQNKYALVDACDFEYLTCWKWCAQKSLNTYYASHRVNRDGKSTTEQMHRLIAKRIGIRAIHIDHKNHNGLDNRRKNLRGATRSQNQANRGITCRNKSGCKGVDFNGKTWRARLQINGQHHYLGRFTSKRKAIIAYKLAERFYFQEFACTRQTGD